MKNNIYKLIGVFAFAVVFTSCSEDKVVYNVDGGQSLAGFNEKTLDLQVFNDTDLADPLLEGYDNTVILTIGSTIRTNYDRTYVVTVNDEFTTADDSQYDMESTFTIPAGQFTGTIKFTGYYNPLPSDWATRSVVVDLESVQGPESQVFNPERIQAIIGVHRGCIQRPAENYTGYISAGPATSTPPFDVKLVRVPATFNTWKVDNLWGDLFATAISDPASTGQYPYPAQIKINCDNTVNVFGTADYGTSQGNTGTYNPSSKQIRASFVNSGLFTTSFSTTVDLYPN
jgi:hypothetical protein